MRPSLRFIWLCCLLLVLLAPAATAQIAVDTFADELETNGNCSLREAVVNSNRRNQDFPDCAEGTGLIVLVPGTYTLSINGPFEDGALTGDLDILDDLTIQGLGTGERIIDGDGIDRVFHVTTFSEIQTSQKQQGLSGPSFILNDVTVTGGLAPLPLLKTNVAPFTPHGGGILNEGGTLTLTNVTVTGNGTADDNPGHGGGIANIPGFEDEVLLLPGDATFTNVTISNNATGDITNTFVSGFGGGLFNQCGTVLMDGVTVEGNATGNVDEGGDDGEVAGVGGGIANAGGTITLINNSLVTNNQTGSAAFDFSVGGAGGGIANFEGLCGEATWYGTLTIEDSDVTNNTTGPGGVLGGPGGGIANFEFGEIGGPPAAPKRAPNRPLAPHGAPLPTITITNAEISGNTTGNATGALFDSWGGPGGGIANLKGIVSLANASVTNNTSGMGTANGFGGPGGGIFTGAVCMDSCEDAPEDITLDLEETTVADNQTGSGGFGGGNGGGIFNGPLFVAASVPGKAAAPAQLSLDVTITASTISGNATGDATDDGFGGSGGGIAHIEGDMDIVNATISGNTTGDGTYPGSGGGIYISTDFAPQTNLDLNNVTITDNETGTYDASPNGLLVGGGGLFANLPARKTNQGGSSIDVSVQNTIIAENRLGDANQAGPDCLDVTGSINSQGYNLIGDASDCEGFTEDEALAAKSTAVAATGDIVGDSENPVDPVLGPLQDNGGATETHALLPSSPAIDAGNNDTCEDTDQRGVARPVDGDGVDGAVCDIGAYEATAVTADLGISKDVDEPAPDLFDTVTYTLTVVNNGPLASTGATVTDVLPEGVAFVSASPEGVYNPDTGTWTVGPLGVSEESTLTITATVETVGEKTNTATITSFGQPDDIVENNSASASLTPIAADLALTKRVTDFTRNRDGSISAVFTLTVTNDGPNDASGVQVTDTMDERLVLVEAVASQGSFAETTGVWNVGSLSAGASATLALSVTAETDEGLFNTAEITASDQPDPDSTPANGTAGEDDLGSARIGRRIPDPHRLMADLSLSKTVDNETPVAGTTVVYTITVSNNGPSHTNGVAVLDVLPEGVAFVSVTSSVQCPTCGYDPTTGIWTVGLLHEDTSATLEITVEVTGSGTITNTAEVSGNHLRDPDSTPGNNDAQEDDQASASLTVQEFAQRFTDGALPTTVALQANYPNPFNPETVIPFAVPEAGPVTLRVYDLLGRVVQTLVDGPVGAGYHTATFQANALPTGVYLVRLQVGDDIKTRRITLVK